MAPTIFTLRPDLNAAAYLIEIMIAEALFLRPYKVRTTGLAGGLLSPYKGLFPACARKAH